MEVLTILQRKTFKRIKSKREKLVRLVINTKKGLNVQLANVLDAGL